MQLQQRQQQHHFFRHHEAKVPHVPMSSLFTAEVTCHGLKHQKRAFGVQYATTT